MTVHRQIKFRAEETNYKVYGLLHYVLHAETWTMTQADKNKLEAFEIWIRRGWRKSVGRIQRRMRKFYVWFKRTGRY